MNEIISLRQSAYFNKSKEQTESHSGMKPTMTMNDINKANRYFNHQNRIATLTKGVVQKEWSYNNLIKML